MSYAEYCAERRKQLVKCDFPFWVYRHDAIGCDGRHEDLNGLALPPNHPFWQHYFPPLDSECGCYVLGARSESGIRRLGGDPEKPITAACELIIRGASDG